MSLRNLLAGPFAALTPVGRRAATAQHCSSSVGTDWLEQNLKNPKVRVVEVSVNPGLYGAAISRARPTSAGIPTWSTPSCDIAPPAQFRRCWRAPASTPIPPRSCTATTTTGSRPGAPGCSTSARHPEREALDDGGRKKWGGRGRPLASCATVRAPGSARVKTPTRRCARGCRTCWPWRVRKKPGVLVDIRSADEYNGKDLRAQRRA